MTSLNPMLMHSGPPRQQPLLNLRGDRSPYTKVIPDLLSTCGLLPDGDSMKSVPDSLLLVASSFFFFFSPYNSFNGQNWDKRR